MKKVSFIDSLHIANHKQELCHQIYSPELLKSELPDANTMIAEQTFTWLSRYKVLFLFILLSHFERNNYPVIYKPPPPSDQGGKVSLSPSSYRTWKKNLRN